MARAGEAACSECTCLRTQCRSSRWEGLCVLFGLMAAVGIDCSYTHAFGVQGARSRLELNPVGMVSCCCSLKTVACVVLGMRR
jgi:hypothetical protein